MLRITTIDAPGERKLVLEGSVIEPWVAELRRAVDRATEASEERKLVIDLRGVTIISSEGRDVLSQIMSQGARFVCCGVYVKHVLLDLQAGAGPDDGC